MYLYYYCLIPLRPVIRAELGIHYMHDRFIIKVSSLHGSDHINLGLLSLSSSWTIVFRHSQTTHARPARLSFRENIILKTIVTRIAQTLSYIWNLNWHFRWIFLPFFRCKTISRPESPLCHCSIYT